MKNPGLLTVKEILTIIKKHQPIYFNRLAEIRANPRSKRKSNGFLSRYLKYLLERSIIKIVKEEHVRGPLKSNFYELTERGERLLEVLKDFPVEAVNK